MSPLRRRAAPAKHLGDDMFTAFEWVGSAGRLPCEPMAWSGTGISDGEIHLLNNLVGASEHGWRDGDPKGLGGREIDHQLEPGGSVDWQLSRFDASEQATSL